jgi:hypothetical protein
MKDFLHDHWGDLIGLFVLEQGIFLLFSHDPFVKQTGVSLIMAALVALKLKSNGNGSGSAPAAPAA